MTVGAVELAVRRAAEFVGEHGERLAVVGLHLGIVVAAQALVLDSRGGRRCRHFGGR